ncbi:DUF3995 domain-containing protein [Leptospira fluminis]|uniref:DUF3995 domain-containing protein n=1 Tax=Leptospira fluminis TaxID=2484979 RepID=A0A4R9GRS1_9LEPT|nr:DUF3995 domain-containing protein [Leptospira fluminis]TGK20781.1 DUF3995 domain-containing protein [Leptospira fluminis]
MQDWITSILVAIFVFLGSMHFYWSFGGNWGSDSAIPQLELEGRPAFLPGVFSTFIIGLAFWFTAAWVLGFSQIYPSPIGHRAHRIGLILVGAVFVLRSIGEFRYVGFFKKVKGTKFAYWDSRIYSPLCLLIGFLAFYLSFSY